MKRELPEKILTRTVSFDNSNLLISICKTYKFYDIIVECRSSKTLRKLNKILKINSSVIRDGIFGKPILVVNTSDSEKDSKYVLEELIKEIESWTS